MTGRLVLKNFRIVDENTDMTGSVIVEDGIIREVVAGKNTPGEGAALIVDGMELRPDGETETGDGGLPLLMPAFVDLHAHFRDSVFSGGRMETASPVPSETLESACLAAAAGGFGTVVCMANTRPPVDTTEKARLLRERSGVLGLVDLYPAVSLTKNMEGKELSEIARIPCPGERDAAVHSSLCYPLLLSEDGRDIDDDVLFLSAMKEARRLGVPVSCHCDCGGPEAEEAKRRGEGRNVWSRIEENNAVRRAITLGKEAGCHIHIAHVSTREAAALVREAKAECAAGRGTKGFVLTAEAAPHHIACTGEDARRMGDETLGRVNPPLRGEGDRQAVIGAIIDGTIDAIATDHAPHTGAEKAAGAPGFTGLETAFAACYTELVAGGRIDLRRLSALMSANPARILGLGKTGGRAAPGTGTAGTIAPGTRADFCAVQTETAWTVESPLFRSRGKCTPFAGRSLRGTILFTIHQGRIVYVQHG
ncbi:MAG: dihydroorotase [Treponema sp.]|jgi:dihydroorotase|nr:dihydroorotase [Treponema sp.]